LVRGVEMKDKVNFKGHFKIQAIDKDNKVVDEWSDDNMIMEGARATMSEIFSNLNSNTFVNYLKIGSLGHVGDNIILPKDANNGFVKERDRMFSEFETVSDGYTVQTLRLNDIVKYTGNDNYYRYIGSETTQYQITNEAVFDDTAWVLHSEEVPYVYQLNFDIPGTNVSAEGDNATINEEIDSFGNTFVSSGSEVKVAQSGSTVTFTFDIATSAGNEQQNGLTSIFTEASLWANDRIFAMKTFKAKVKDSTVLLRIVWSITF